MVHCRRGAKADAQGGESDGDKSEAGASVVYSGGASGSSAEKSTLKMR